MLPNIPIFHWRENKDKKVAENCWKVPNILNLHYNNKYWQVKESSNGTFYLYAAYYDVREVQIKNITKFLVSDIIVTLEYPTICQSLSC